MNRQYFISLFIQNMRQKIVLKTNFFFLLFDNTLYGYKVSFETYKKFLLSFGLFNRIKRTNKTIFQKVQHGFAATTVQIAKV